MLNTLISLVYDWTNGVVMISVFAFVCLVLIGILVNFMTSGKNNNDSNETN